MTRPIPPKLFPTGASVAVVLPLGPGAIAHKPAADKRKTTKRPWRGEAVYQDVAVAACDPKGPQAAEFSAAWADHQGALACTEPACFPNA
ncbi:hypothetical protein AB0M02_00280 [Actinoplanes sp. NPDC051861]|uniref:hypothetical protein n=1 Tax=Actinoplanes sp. NPDC051861 TaxID=3155170 RepID=UPI003426F841